MQHHIARGLAWDTCRRQTIVEIAEAIGAADWKDRSVDVAAEAEQLFAGLGAAANSTLQSASLQRSGSGSKGTQ